MTTAVREPRARRAEARGNPNQPAYVAAASRRRRRAAVLGDGPWRKSDRTIVLGGCVIGLAGLAICSWQGSGEVDLSSQMNWLLVGIGCVSLSSVCLAYWLLSGLRAVRIEVAKVFGTIKPDIPAPDAVTGTGFVTVTGMVRYHRPECPLVAGKTVRQVSGDAEGLKPCGACGS